MKMTAEQLRAECEAVVPGEWSVYRHWDGLLAERRSQHGTPTLSVYWVDVEPVAYSCEASVEAPTTVWRARETSPARAIRAVRDKIRRNTWPWPEPTEAP